MDRNHLESEEKRLCDMKDQYHVLRSRMETLLDKLSHDIMVPVGEAAFMQGQIVKTNEVLVLLGDNYFALRSCKQAVEIIDRRLTHLETLLTNVKKRKNLMSISTAQSTSSDIIRIIPDIESGGALVNINEKCETVERPKKTNRIAHEPKAAAGETKQNDGYTKPKGVSQAEFEALMEYLDDLDEDSDGSDDQELDDIAKRLSGLPLEDADAPKPQDRKRRKVHFENKSDTESRQIINVADEIGVRETTARSILKNKDDHVYVDENKMVVNENKRIIQPIQDTVMAETVVENVVNFQTEAKPNDLDDNDTNTEAKRPMSKFKRDKMKR